MASSAGDAWPASVVPDFTEVNVGIARTEPKCDDQDEVREVEALFHDMIEAADRSIYIENQFVTCREIAERLAQRMRRKPCLETLIVTPQSYHSWIEGQTMRVGRRRFADVLAESGVSGRARMVYPEIRQDGRRGDTMVHSKVTIIDDRLLRVGSANLNNRSMGTDTECDLVIEAESEEQRTAVRRVRDRLVADHCGVGAEEAAAAIDRAESLIDAVERLSGRGHRLSPIDDGEQLDSTLVRPIEQLSDPREPITAEGMVENLLGPDKARGLPAIARVAALIAGVAALIVAWRYTPLADIADPELLRGYLAMFDGPGGAIMVVAGFAVAGLVGFPVTVLIIATAAAFGPWLGGAYAGAGAVLSAVAAYAVGTMLGRKTVASLLGSRLEKARRRILQQGIFAVTTLRLVPIAPFVMINIACGAFGIRLRDFVVGTMFGMAPGIVALAALGHQFYALLTAPTQTGVAIFAALIVVWIGLAILLQRLVARSARS